MIFWFLGLAAFGFYLYGLAPGLTVGDSGELITAIHRLGVAHPPGYPLYTLCGKAVSLFGLAAPSYRANVFSALPGAAAAALWGLLCARLTGTSIAGLAAFGMLALSPEFRIQSASSEVYTFHALWVALLFWVLFRRKKILFFFGWALSLGAHYLSLLFLPAYALVLFPLRRMGEMAAVALLGVTVFLYMPIRSSSHPPIDWGETRHAGGFWRHIARQQYRAMEFGEKPGATDRLRFIQDISLKLRQQAGSLGLLVSLAGLFALARSRQLFATTLSIFLLNTIGIAFILRFRYTPDNVEVVYPYYLPAYMVLFLWFAFGVNTLFLRVKGKFGLFPARALSALLVTFCLLTGNGRSVFAHTSRRDFLVEDFGRDIFRSLPAKAALILEDEVDEVLFALCYLHRGLGFRRDSALYDSYENIFTGLYGQTYLQELPKEKRAAVRRMKEENIAGKEILYSTINPDSRWFSRGLLFSREKQGNLWPHFRGAGRFVRHTRKLDYRTQEVFVRWGYLEGRARILTGDKSSIKILKEAVADGKDLVWLLNNTGDLLRQKGFFSEAEDFLKRAAFLDPLYLEAWYNLGLLYEGRGELGEAASHYERAHIVNKQDQDTRQRLSSIFEKLAYRAYQRGEFPKAVSHYREALQVHPTAEAFYNLGVLYDREGQRPQAKEAFEKFLTLAPQGARAKEVREWVGSH